jgi:hypothetical protein
VSTTCTRMCITVVLSTMRDFGITTIKLIAVGDRRHPLTPPRAAESTMLWVTTLTSSSHSESPHTYGHDQHPDMVQISLITWHCTFIHIRIYTLKDVQIHSLHKAKTSYISKSSFAVIGTEHMFRPVPLSLNYL